MKRRNFLGFLTGAAVAGPAAAKEVLIANPVSATTGVGNVLGHVGSGVTHTAQLSLVKTLGLPLNKVTRINKFVRLLNGEEQADPPDPYDAYRRNVLIAENSLAAIRSISNSARITILDKRMAAIRAESKREEWLWNIFHLSQPDDDQNAGPIY